MLAALPGLRFWGADGLGLNRVVLPLAPLAIVWMAVAMRGAPAPAVEPVAADEAPAP